MTQTDTEKRTLSKRNLELVTAVTEVKYGPEGAKTLWKFGAVDRSLPEEHGRAGKPIGFATFSQSIKEHLEGLDKGTVFVGDYEIKPRPDKPEFGPDITVIQVWVNGKPIYQKSQGPGRGGGRSLADDLALEAVKRRSIEAQNALGQVTALIPHLRPADATLVGMEGPDELKRITGKFWRVVEMMLDNYLNGPGPAATPQKPPEKSRQPLQWTRTSEAAPADPAPSPAASEKAAAPVKNIGDLLTRASKLKPSITPPQVLAILGIEATDQIDDLDVAWDVVLLAHYKANGSDDGLDKSSEQAWSELERERKVTP